MEESPVSQKRKPMIRVRHLSHWFENSCVLNDVSFDVNEGEIFGFIGPNGAGKTTTIRIMSTMLEPMAGRVEINGFDVAVDPFEVRKCIGYMPDYAGIYERIGVVEYLEFFADAYGVSSSSVVQAVLEITGLNRIETKMVSALSKGMKQRLQLGRILLHDPKILILDEPASDLDPRARIEIRDLLLGLKDLGKTVLISSHILTELSDICSSVAILERGRLIVSGPIRKINEELHRIQSEMATQARSSENHFSHELSSESPNPVQAEIPTKKVKIRLLLLSQVVAAQVLCKQLHFVVEVQDSHSILSVRFQGLDENIALLVKHLVQNGIDIIGIEPERKDLERIFLEVTRGEVQ